MNNTAASKALCAIVSCAIILSMLGSLPNIVRAAGNFNIGDTVEVINTLDIGLRIRDTPAGNVIGNKPNGNLGVVRWSNSGNFRWY